MQVYAHMSATSKAHVARLHYERDLGKQEIATRLGISRFKVARLLDAARAEGIVRFEIAEPVATDDAAARALESAYGLDLAVVTAARDDPDAVARAAAAWLPELLEGRSRLGVAWGSMLQRVAAGLPPGRSWGAAPRQVVQICGAIAGLEQGTGPAELALRFAERLGARLHALPAPALPGPAARAALLRDPAIAPTVAEFDRLDLALMGVGRGESFPRAPAGAAAHLLTQVVDDDGAPLAAPGAAIALSREQLERTRVLAVAGGAEKSRAVRAALRTGLVDVLVCDRAAAAEALA